MTDEKILESGGSDNKNYVWTPQMAKENGNGPKKEISNIKNLQLDEAERQKKVGYDYF